ncbi:hypothetical protein [Candidatus Chlorohelix sp.]|uniref:hypothetical protein n=1 Tax=Candidatus Chlorohelix sp. TaxID=3139201 RepID=UPI003026FAAC
MNSQKNLDVEMLKQIRHYYHDINQPLTTIILLSDMGASSDGLTIQEAKDLYEAALSCRELLASFNDYIETLDIE